MEEMHVVNGQDKRGAVRGMGRVKVPVQGMAELVRGFGRAPAGVSAVENAEEQSGGGEFGAHNIGAGDGGGKGVKSGLDQESESERVIGTRGQGAGILHGDLPQPHMRAAAVADINQNEGRRLNHQGGENEGGGGFQPAKTPQTAAPTVARAAITAAPVRTICRHFSRTAADSQASNCL